MFPAIHVWLRTAAALIFSTAIGFLVLGLPVQLSLEVPPQVSVFGSLGGLSILVAAIFASLTAGASLNWTAISSGCAIGVLAMGSWWMAQMSLRSPIPHTILIPLTLSTLTVAATVDRLPAPAGTGFYSTSRFVSVVHLLQGAFLFGVVLPSAIAWRWPRPFAAAIVCSAFALWRFWRGCPLTLAENKLRVREGMHIIPPNEGFIKDIFDRWGIPVFGEIFALALHGIGIALCSWWGIEWLMSLFNRG